MKKRWRYTIRLSSEKWGYFWDGFSSVVLDLGHTPEEEPEIENPWDEDWRAIAGDWRAVGSYLVAADKRLRARE